MKVNASMGQSYSYYSSYDGSQDPEYFQVLHYFFSVSPSCVGINICTPIYYCFFIPCDHIRILFNHLYVKGNISFCGCCWRPLEHMSFVQMVHFPSLQKGRYMASFNAFTACDLLWWQWSTKVLYLILQIHSTVLRGPVFDEVHQRINSWIYQVLPYWVLFFSSISLFIGFICLPWLPKI